MIHREHPWLNSPRQDVPYREDSYSWALANAQCEVLDASTSFQTLWTSSAGLWQLFERGVDVERWLDRVTVISSRTAKLKAWSSQHRTSQRQGRTGASASPRFFGADLRSLGMTAAFLSSAQLGTASSEIGGIRSLRSPTSR